MDNELIKIPVSDDDLLEECTINTFRSSGKGGQHINKTDTAVRLIHRPTGIIVKCQQERSQLFNKKQCLINLRSKLEKLNERPEERIPTKVPRSVKKRRLGNKLVRGKKKDMRKRPSVDD